MSKRCVSSVIVFTLVFLTAIPIARAQNQKTANPDSDAEKKKLLETKTLALVDALSASIQELKLPENRVRTGATLGNMLWTQDPDRARNLFRQAETTLIAMEGAITTEEPDWAETIQNVLNVRNEIVQMIAANDPEFALEFLTATRMPASVAPQWAKTNEVDLEMQITQSVAAKNPAVALARAEESLTRGLSWNLTSVVSQLLQKDPDKAARLAEEIADKITGDDLLIQNSQASGILMNILGTARQYQIAIERKSNNEEPAAIVGRYYPATGTLPDATFRKLLDPLVNVVLKVNLATNDPNEKGIAFQILGWMQTQDALLLKYESSQSDVLQRKLAQYQQINGISAGTNLNQLMQTASPDAIVRAAANVPSTERVNYYYQASQKASAEGNTDLAEKIIDDNIKEPGARDQGYLNLYYNFVNSGKLDAAENIVDTKIEDATAKNNALTYINDKKFRDSVAQSKLEDALALVSRLPQQQQVDKLMQISATMFQTGKKDSALLYLDQAWSLLPSKAANTNQLQLQINVASAFASVDAVRASANMQPIITRLNDLLRAAETLNGFDVNYYKDGELTMQGGSLQAMVRQCGSALALIAAQDFDQAKNLSEMFERPEAKIMAQLVVVTQLMQTRSLQREVKSYRTESFSRSSLGNLIVVKPSPQ